LRNGEIVAVPTETVYGLAADALNEAAVQKIFEAKGRPLIDPLIVHVGNMAGVAQLAEVPPVLEKLATRFWPGPLTVVLQKKDHVPSLVTAGMPTVAIRMPAHPLIRKLLLAFGGVLAAPSANPFGYVSPTTAGHVRDSLGDRVPWIMDGGSCAHGLESTIIHLADPAGPRLLRPGPISRDDLEQVLGVHVLPAPSHLDQQTAQIAPGMLARHYSPATPLILHKESGSLEKLANADKAQSPARVWLQRPATIVSGDYWLSEDGSLTEIGRNMFSLLRQLDSAGFPEIHIELPEDAGIGVAINDRLRRAAAKR
ncbi:MAG: threonylcarbamoyl-AMP synthase, partial [Puniceicoccales bacterium]|jgi:L-threonylcarbamoyladenylate synthase|nr:threonylcarbamoyl-AMP synthase [Puniceicoccales bacterium]